MEPTAGAAGAAAQGVERGRLRDRLTLLLYYVDPLDAMREATWAISHARKPALDETGLSRCTSSGNPCWRWASFLVLRLPNIIVLMMLTRLQGGRRRPLLPRHHLPHLAHRLVVGAGRDGHPRDGAATAAARRAKRANSARTTILTYGAGHGRIRDAVRRCPRYPLGKRGV